MERTGTAGKLCRLRQLRARPNPSGIPGGAAAQLGYYGAVALDSAPAGDVFGLDAGAGKIAFSATVASDLLYSICLFRANRGLYLAICLPSPIRLGKHRF